MTSSCGAPTFTLHRTPSAPERLRTAASGCTRWSAQGPLSRVSRPPCSSCWELRARRSSRRYRRLSSRAPSAYLLLEDGTRFDGEAVGAEVEATGEVVFNTAMTGYQEAVTDPSYHGQIFVFTYPLIGNYGVSGEEVESDRVHARAVIMREAQNDSGIRSAADRGSLEAGEAGQGWL